MSYWFNTSTGQVETDEDRGQAQDVMGPYESEADARNALKSAHDRTETWDAEDRDWNGRGAIPGASDDD
ncbi:MAG: methionine aminopeptidase [Lapillicoccus sp.]